MTVIPPPAGDPVVPVTPAAAPVTPTTPPTPPVAPAAQTVESLPDWAQAIIRDTRTEAATHRTKLREVEGKLSTFETAQLTEAEKLQKRATDAEASAKTISDQLKATNTRLEFERQARKLNIVDEELAFLAIAGKVETDDTGKPKNLEALLTQLVKDKPFLAQAAGGAGGTGGAAGNPGVNHGGITADKLKSMTRDQIMAIPDADLIKILAGK